MSRAILKARSDQPKPFERDGRLFRFSAWPGIAFVLGLACTDYGAYRRASGGNGGAGGSDNVAGAHHVPDVGSGGGPRGGAGGSGNVAGAHHAPDAGAGGAPRRDAGGRASLDDGDASPGAIGGSGETGTILDRGHYDDGSALSGGPQTDAAGGSGSVRDGRAARDAASKPSADGALSAEGGSPYPVVDTVMWNDGSTNAFTPIRTCFTVSPHEEWDGPTRCQAQTDADRACNGERFDGLGTSASALRARVRALVENSWQRYGQVEFDNGSWGDCRTDRDAGVTDVASAIIDITFVSSCTLGDAGCIGGVGDPPPWDEVRGRLGKGQIPTDVHLDWKRLLRGDDDGGVIHELGHALGFRHSQGDASCPIIEQRDYDDAQGWSILNGFDAVVQDTDSAMGA